MGTQAEWDILPQIVAFHREVRPTGVSFSQRQLQWGLALSGGETFRS